MTQTPTAPDRTGATAPDDLALAIPGTTVRGRAARVLPQDRPDTTSWAPRAAESRAATSRPTAATTPG
ncbi:acyl-CoA desaturase, partial [Micrococcus luteus]|nr:acyl-CoA desaturase [Micrococcus luteus]